MNGTPFDLGSITAVDTVEMAVNDAAGKPTTWIWTIAGPAHPRTMELRQDENRELLEATVKLRRRAAGETIPEEPIRTRDENLDILARKIARRVLSWTPVRINGEALECTPENVVKVLLDPRLVHLLGQYNAFVSADQSFMPRSAASS